VARGGRERVLLQQTLAESDRDRDRAASKPKKENHLEKQIRSRQK